MGFFISKLFNWFHWWRVYCSQWLLWKAHNRLTFVVDILTDWNPQTTRRLTARGFLQLLSRVIKSFFKWLCTSLRYPEVLCALDAAGFHWVELYDNHHYNHPLRRTLKFFFFERSMDHWQSSQASIEGAESGLDLSFVSKLKVLGLQLGVVKVDF